MDTFDAASSLTVASSSAPARSIRATFASSRPEYPTAPRSKLPLTWPSTELSRADWPDRTAAAYEPTITHAVESAMATAARDTPPLPGRNEYVTRVVATTRTAVGTMAPVAAVNVPVVVSKVPSCAVTVGVAPNVESLRATLSARDWSHRVSAWITWAWRPSSSRARSSATTSASDCMSTRPTRC